KLPTSASGSESVKGLMRRLDYLHGLGITAIWLMPFQVSPHRDDGYDVSDYYGVDPRYGTIGDFVEFTHGAKQRPRRQPHGGRAPVVQTGAQGPGFEVPRLVRLVEEEAAALRSRHGISGRAEIDLELRPGGQGVVLPSFLRLPARSQHLAS